MIANPINDSIIKYDWGRVIKGFVRKNNFFRFLFLLIPVSYVDCISRTDITTTVTRLVQQGHTNTMDVVMQVGDVVSTAVFSRVT